MRNPGSVSRTRSTAAIKSRAINTETVQSSASTNFGNWFPSTVAMDNGSQADPKGWQQKHSNAWWKLEAGDRCALWAESERMSHEIKINCKCGTECGGKPRSAQRVEICAADSYLCAGGWWFNLSSCLAASLAGGLLVAFQLVVGR